MSAESPGLREHQPNAFHTVHARFHNWRGQRPFWAGLLTLLGGIPIAYFPYANMTLGQLTVRMSTTAGAGSLVIGVLLAVLGLTMWYQPAVRIFAGVAAILLALVSIPVSNIGGFLIGFLLSLLGGALSVAWAPGVPVAAEPDGASVDGGAAVPQQQSYGPQLEKNAASPGAGTDDETTNDHRRA
ncbi:hypothetical protein G3I60_12715 [Streptomyces sp. SID13666]|uniref:DUF6114 domain-containing protein n=1 Tax=unclassified Streptomyces TaxID=2593676 RepID=UPI0013BFB466|nr:MULTISPECIES: DUF6114 domain-containing protein [unclassified Streptomyces]NEA54983.1 hypothetical protein [Streptomyces sp. SID13666]NEA70785.1 hypothetical protein [Streptomyces sp. SID13588]